MNTIFENKNYFVIDVHTHILPEKMPDWRQKFGYGEWISLEHHKPCCARMMMDGELFREIESNCWSGSQRIIEADKQHVDVQVISTVPVMFSYWAQPKDTLEVSKYLNNHIASVCNQYPKRFVGLGNIPMQDTGLAIHELEHCKQLGLKGVQIGSHINNWNLNQVELMPVYEAAQDLGMCIFVHPWWWLAKLKMPHYWLPWLVGMPAETSLAICSMIFGGVFEKYPKLRVLFAHGGGAFPGTLGRIEHGWKSRPDLVAVDNPFNPRKYINSFWLDALVHDKTMLEYIVSLFTADKVAMGTDYPFPLGEDKAGELIHSCNFDFVTKEKLLSGAALEWLNLDKNYFI